MISRIKEAREILGMSQAQFAESLGKSQRTVSAWETGIHEPSLDLLCRIADMCNVTTDYLLGRTDIKTIGKDPDPQARKRDLVVGEAALNGDSVKAPSEDILQLIDAAVQRALAERGIPDHSQQ